MTIHTILMFFKALGWRQIALGPKSAVLTRGSAALHITPADAVWSIEISRPGHDLYKSTYPRTEDTPP